MNDFNLSPELTQSLATSLKILFILTVLSVLPSLVIMMTSFVRVVIVLSLLRQAIGTPTTPPNIVIVSLSLILTFFIMSPTFKKVYDQVIIPYNEKKISDVEAIKRAYIPFKEFMLKNTRKKDIAFFVKLSKEKIKNPKDVPFYILIPAFMLTELTIAFQMVFTIFIPFLVIDLIVASLLISLGIMMLPPVMLSLPLKILLFVSVDGWTLLFYSLIKSFNY